MPIRKPVRILIESFDSFTTCDSWISVQFGQNFMEDTEGELTKSFLDSRRNSKLRKPIYSR